MLNQFFLHIPKEEFEKMCINELKLLEKKSKEIEFKIKMEYGKIPNDYEQKLFCKLIKLIFFFSKSTKISSFCNSSN